MTLMKTRSSSASASQPATPASGHGFTHSDTTLFARRSLDALGVLAGSRERGSGKEFREVSGALRLAFPFLRGHHDHGRASVARDGLRPTRPRSLNDLAELRFRLGDGPTIGVHGFRLRAKWS